MTMRLVVWEMPVAPSANHLYPTGKDGKRHKSKEYEEFAETQVLAMQLGQHPGRRGMFDHKRNLPWTLTIWANIDHKRDLLNIAKAPEDIAATYLGLRDSYDNDIVLKRSQFRPDGTVLPAGWCICIIALNDELGEEVLVRGNDGTEQGVTHERRPGGAGANGGAKGRTQRRAGAAAAAAPRPRVVPGGPGERRPSRRGRR